MLLFPIESLREDGAIVDAQLFPLRCTLSTTARISVFRPPHPAPLHSIPLCRSVPVLPSCCITSSLPCFRNAQVCARKRCVASLLSLKARQTPINASASPRIIHQHALSLTFIASTSTPPPPPTATTNTAPRDAFFLPLSPPRTPHAPLPLLLLLFRPLSLFGTGTFETVVLVRSRLLLIQGSNLRPLLLLSSFSTRLFSKKAVNHGSAAAPRSGL